MVFVRPASQDLARARWAVAALFFANGFVMGSWAPQIPVLLGRLAIMETTLGLLILVFGVGALAAMPVCGIIMARTGSRPALAAFAFSTSVALLAVAVAPNLWFAAPAMLFFGGSVGAMDVAMNTNAVAVEQRLGRAIMSSSHGFWSLGGFVGSASGGAAILAIGHLGHAALVTAVTLAIVVAALPFVVSDPPPARGSVAATHGMPRQPAIYLIGLMALLCMVPEGAVLDWAALHLRQAFASDIATAGLAFALFSGAMAIMRFAGDRVRDRFGAVLTLRVSALLAAGAMFAASVAPTAWLAVAAFAIAGFGIANTVPIAFSAAGAQSGMGASTGMSVATTMGYSGILVAPSLIGFVGERTGFGFVFGAVAMLLMLVAMMATLASAADQSNSARRVPEE